jgi:hypothetical protein
MIRSMLFGLPFALLVTACGSGSAPAAEDVAGHEPTAAAAVGTAWRTYPAEGSQLRLAANGATVVATGPHTILWSRDAAILEPPYVVRAVLHKRIGRIHEGFGLLFGGDPMDAPEEQQAYSYFLVRGDGSYLIRRREGAALPILRGWSSDRAIRRDNAEGGQPNELEVAVGTDTTVFRVNGSEVARLPTAELRVRGRAGIRVAHDVTLEIRDFSVSPTSAPEDGG